MDYKWIKNVPYVAQDSIQMSFLAS